MAFFKSRKGGDEPQAPTSTGQRQPESIEAMRRRAKHRLIGASVLVLVGVVGFPLLFDTQPRPISVDIPIEIPDRNKVKPLPAPAPAAAGAMAKSSLPQTPAATGAVTAAPAAASAATTEVAKAETPAAKPEQKAEQKAEPKVESKPQPQAPAKPDNKPEPKAQPKTEQTAKADDGARAQALLEGKAASATPAATSASAEGRFVVQVGSFSENDKAREARLKLEHAGLKTYTQVVEKDGKRLIRVRVGPFASKADADKAASKVKGLDLQAAVLTL